MFRRSLFALALALPSVADAADNRPARPEWTYKMDPFSFDTKVFVFPSGLRIMFQSDRSAPVVLVHSVVNYGTKDDPVGKEETAHFVEHLWFRSKHGSLPTVMDLIGDIGARFNATTRNDWTDYRTVTSKEFLPLLLQMESLRLTEPYIGVTEEQVDVEREVIRNEWRRRNEQNVALLFDYLYDAVYPDDHPYGRMSSHESIDHIKLADLQKFMDDYYRPEHTTIFVVGDFDIQAASSMAFENFAPELLHPDLKPEHLFKYPRPGVKNPDPNRPTDWYVGAYDPKGFPEKKEVLRLQDPNTIPPRITDERPPLPPVGTTEVQRRKAPVTNPYVLVGFSLPGGFRSDEYNHVVLANVASSFVTSGLTDAIRNKWIGDIGCFAQSEIVNTTLMCLAEIRKKDKVDMENVANTMIDGIAPMWNPELLPYYAPAISRARQETLRDMLLNVDVVAQEFGARAEDLVPHAHYTGSAASISDAMGKIMNLEAASMSKMAYNYLQRDRAAVVIVEPLDDDEIDVGSERSTYSGSGASDGLNLTPSDDLSAVTDAQIAASYARPDFSDAVTRTLPNGLKVIAVPQGDAPTVLATLIFGGGQVAEPWGLHDFASWFTESQGHDPLPIAASTSYFVTTPSGFSTVGGGFGAPMTGPFKGSNFWTMQVRAPNRNVDGALWLLREEMETAHPMMAGKPDWIDDQRKALRGDIRKRGTGVWDSVDWHVTRAQMDHLYPNSLRSRTDGWEDIETWSSWNAETIQGYLNEHMRPSNATLLLVGRTGSPDELMSTVEKYLGGWKDPQGATQTNHMVLPTPPPAANGTKMVLFDEPTRTQSEVRTMCRLNYAGPQDDAAVGVLSSFMWNRAFKILRVQEGLAYSPGGGANAQVDGTAGLTFYSLAVNVGVGRTIEVFQQTAAEFESGQIDPLELRLHKLREARANGVSIQSIDQVTESVVGVLRKGRGLDAIEKQGEEIAAVTVDDLRRLIKGCTANTITTIQGPVDVLKPQLDERGWSYEVAEWKGTASELLLKYDPKSAKLKEKLRVKDEEKKAKEDAKKGEAPKKDSALMEAPDLAARSED